MSAVDESVRKRERARYKRVFGAKSTGMIPDARSRCLQTVVVGDRRNPLNPNVRLTFVWLPRKYSLRVRHVATPSSGRTGTT